MIGHSGSRELLENFTKWVATLKPQMCFPTVSQPLEKKRVAGAWLIWHSFKGVVPPCDINDLSIHDRSSMSDHEGFPARTPSIPHPRDQLIPPYRLLATGSTFLVFVAVAYLGPNHFNWSRVSTKLSALTGGRTCLKTLKFSLCSICMSVVILRCRRIG